MLSLDHFFGLKKAEIHEQFIQVKAHPIFPVIHIQHNGNTMIF